MSDAPERIWASTGLYYDYAQDWTEGEWLCNETGGVEYIRADIVREMLRDAMKDKDYEC